MKRLNIFDKQSIKTYADNTKQKRKEAIEDIKIFGLIDYVLMKSGDHVINYIDKKVEAINEKVDVLLTIDPTGEGWQKGTQRAKEEYEQAYEKIKKEYEDIIQLENAEKENIKNTATELIDKLAILEKKREELEQEINMQNEKVAKKYNVPIETIGSFSFHNTHESILGMIYKNKKDKIQQAEKDSYEEVKQTHILKVKNLQTDLDKKRNGFCADKTDLWGIITGLLEDIAKQETKIAELKIVLGDD